MAVSATIDPDGPPGLANERWVLCPTPEHLLLSILGDIEVVAALRGCRACERALADAVRAHIAAVDRVSRPRLALASLLKRRPQGMDLSVERVLARATIRAKGSDRPSVRSADVLLSLLDEPGCVAGDLLRAQGVTRYDALNYVSHRIVKGSEPPVPPKPASPWILWGVSLHNDHYTPMEFVVHVLETVFDKDREHAVRLMLEIHRNGSAECGVFAYDAALAKVRATTDLGRTQEHALLCALDVKTTGKEGGHAELLT